MKRFNYYLIILLLLASCKKQGELPESDFIGIHECQTIRVAPAYLVGKYKLVYWSASTANVVSCSNVGGNTYFASDWNVEAIINVFSNGKVQTFLNDSLLNESHLTEYVPLSIQNYGGRFDLNCKMQSLIFVNLNAQTDSLQNIQVGDTLKIKNPFLEINFANGSYWTIARTDLEYYVKIE